MKVDISIYRGYMNNKELIISGHVFKSWAPSQYSIERRAIKHAFSILKMFTVKPLSNEKVTLQFQGESVSTKTMKDGYFNFRIPFDKPLTSGWYPCSVRCDYGKFNIVTNGEILKPHTGRYGIISDIDDTFLISHSSNIFKKHPNKVPESRAGATATATAERGRSVRTEYHRTACVFLITRVSLGSSTN